MKNPLHLTVHAYIFWPIAYLATLAVSISVLWWVILIGGRPFEVQEVVAVNAQGEQSDAFRAGDVVGVKRLICSQSRIDLQSFPSLLNSQGFSFPLETALSSTPHGCSSSIYGFLMPALPPGAYTLRSTIRFQNNLVGRDEYSPALPLNIKVTP